MHLTKKFQLDVPAIASVVEFHDACLATAQKGNVLPLGLVKIPR